MDQMSRKLILIILAISITLNGVSLYMYTRPLNKGIKTAALNDNVIENNNILKDLVYHNGQDFSILGRFHNEPNYNRLPIKYQNVIRKEVWSLSNNSSGISI